MLLFYGAIIDCNEMIAFKCSCNCSAIVFRPVNLSCQSFYSSSGTTWSKYSLIECVHLFVVDRFSSCFMVQLSILIWLFEMVMSTYLGSLISDGSRRIGVTVFLNLGVLVLQPMHLVNYHICSSLLDHWKSCPSLLIMYSHSWLVSCDMYQFPMAWSGNVWSQTTYL